MRRPVLVAPDQPDGAPCAAERGDVAGGVAGAAGHDLRRVVFEDQHRRFARDARDVAVDELVDDEVADDGHARVCKTVDDLEQAVRIGPASASRLFASGGAQDPGDRFHQVVDDCGRSTPAFGERFFRPAVAGAHEDATRADRLPRLDVVPAVADHERIASDLTPRSAAARVNMPGRGLRQSHVRR